MIEKVERTSVIFLAIMIFVSIFLKRPLATFSLALGGALAIINFWLLVGIVTKILNFSGRGRFVLMVQAFFKFILLLALLWAILVYTTIDPLFLVIGLSVVILAILRESCGCGCSKENSCSN